MRMFIAARPSAACTRLAVLLVLVLPVIATAQEPVKSFDQLNTRLKVGDTVWVTDAQGREIKGRITSLAVDSLVLDADGPKTLPASQVRVVANRRSDSLANGALIGLGVGLGTGALLVAAGCSDADCAAGEATLAALMVGGIGAGIGVGVDALIPGRKEVVFRSPGASGSAHLSLAPVITRRTKAVAVVYSF